MRGRSLKLDAHFGRARLGIQFAHIDNSAQHSLTDLALRANTETLNATLLRVTQPARHRLGQLRRPVAMVNNTLEMQWLRVRRTPRCR